MAARDERALEDEFQVEEFREGIDSSSRASRFNLIKREFGLDRDRLFPSRESVLKGFNGCSGDLVIHPNNRWYRAWTQFILLWAIYSSFFTPFEFGFFRGLPEHLVLLDIAGQFAFLLDILLQFHIAYKDGQTHRTVTKKRSIALRYLKSDFALDLCCCLPWDTIYKASGRKEELRYLMWVRLNRVRKLIEFFQKIEKDIRINYLFTRIVKLISVELYCTHTAACIFYYLATTLPSAEEEYTWIGSLKLGSYSYKHFRDIDLHTRYLTSLYFAIVTMATVGYGDIHAVNLREMIFIMIFVSFDMILGAYLIGNMTALIVKGSKTERFRDKMTDLIKYLNINKLGKDTRDQIKDHLRLKYESNYTEASVLQDIPVSIRAKISQTLYKSYVENVTLFKGCTSEFINQIVIRLHEEFFLPGAVIMEQGNAVDQLYFVCNGVLEEVGIREDGTEETILQLEPNSSFGEIAILCNIPQPYTVRVCDQCQLLRLDKQCFANILQIYFLDARTILRNLLEGQESDVRLKQLESDITFHIGKQEADLALRVNSASYYGDLYHLKALIRAGADPNKTDYDGRSPLHLAASRGYEDITRFLIQEGVDINSTDKFGNTPLLEAIKLGHDRVASLLVNQGASLNVSDAGCCLCMAVSRGESDFLKRILAYGIDPNSKDYDHRTPLHLAAAEGLYLLAKMLLESGASVFSKDRWGNTPLDEGHRCGSKKLIKLLEDAKSSQLSEYPSSSLEISATMQRRKCTVFPFHPWYQEKRREGVVLWVPRTLEELINSSSKQLKCIQSSYILLSEDAGKIGDVDMIYDDQKLYLTSNPDSS